MPGEPASNWLEMKTCQACQRMNCLELLDSTLTFPGVQGVGKDVGVMERRQCCQHTVGKFRKFFLNASATDSLHSRPPNQVWKPELKVPDINGAVWPLFEWPQHRFEYKRKCFALNLTIKQHAAPQKSCSPKQNNLWISRVNTGGSGLCKQNRAKSRRCISFSRPSCHAVSARTARTKLGDADSKSPNGNTCTHEKRQCFYWTAKSSRASVNWPWDCAGDDTSDDAYSKITGKGFSPTRINENQLKTAGPVTLEDPTVFMMDFDSTLDTSSTMDTLGDSNAEIEPAACVFELAPCETQPEPAKKKKACQDNENLRRSTWLLHHRRGKPPREQEQLVLPHSKRTWRQDELLLKKKKTLNQLLKKVGQIRTLTYKRRWMNWSWKTRRHPKTKTHRLLTNLKTMNFS